MKTPKKLELAFRRIEEIRYENEHGGAYAYLQFMACTRELLTMLRPVQKAERQMEAIEAMSWMLNEYLSVRFTHAHKLIFDEKKSEMKTIFAAIQDLFAAKNLAPVKPERRPFDGKLYHAQAA